MSRRRNPSQQDMETLPAWARNEILRLRSESTKFRTDRNRYRAALAALVNDGESK